VNYKLERMWKEAVAAYVKLQPLHLPGAKETHEKLQSGQPALGPIFEPRTS